MRIKQMQCDLAWAQSEVSLSIYQASSLRLRNTRDPQEQRTRHDVYDTQAGDKGGNADASCYPDLVGARGVKSNFPHGPSTKADWPIFIRMPESRYNPLNV